MTQEQPIRKIPMAELAAEHPDVVDRFVAAVKLRRAYQDQKAKWGHAFDDRNTPNDWVSFIVNYAVKGCTFRVTVAEFQEAMVDVAAIALAAVEAVERRGNTLAKRHYD
jgi:hypothetical protein